MKQLFGAIDLGASSGRVIAGVLSGGQLTLREVHRFPNAAVERSGRLNWDLTGLLEEIILGLKKLNQFSKELSLRIESIGIDTWAVDYGLLKNGSLVSQPNCYRDPINSIGVEAVHKLVSFEELYRVTGLQFLPFNSIYQLARQKQLDSELLEQAEHIVMLPDLIGYFLTGSLRTERTNASSTGLLSATTREWDLGIASAVGIDVGKFPPLADAGELLGAISGDFDAEIAGIKVVLVGSHDTASAVVGAPSLVPGFAFLSSGTWSLLGAELPQPILSEESRVANFTNELGVDGRVRYLKNLSGLWLLSESIRDYELRGQRVDLPNVLKKAEHLKPTQRISVDDPALVAPNHMPARITRQLKESGQPTYESLEELTAIILYSLADTYAAGFDKLKDLTGQSFDALHVIGGGVQNQLLCQLTANSTGTRVYAGPVEATAIGNIMVQARTAGLVGPSLEDIRGVILNSAFEITQYFPQ